MNLISHRGNINGPSEQENHPDYIKQAMNLGFYVEIDIWRINNVLCLGHDLPKYEIEDNYFDGYNTVLLWHAKNPDALDYLLNQGRHCFWHENDRYTLTNKGIPVCYPGISPLNESILMKAEYFTYNSIYSRPWWGICSDYIAKYKND